MKQRFTKSLYVAALALAILPLTTHAQIIISEVDAAGSAPTTGYTADWFELKNIGSSAVNITGWKIDDSSSNFVSGAVLLNGVSSIAAGQSVVFIEDTGMTDAILDANFKTAWFSNNVPAGLTIGNYGGSGLGLSQTADGVNIFDSSGVVQAYVTFGASTLGHTFDNEAGVNGLISTFSSIGTDGAFLSASGLEVGSPGDVAPVPEPASCALTGLGMAALFVFRNRNRS
jgi:hypothetical protein